MHRKKLADAAPLSVGLTSVYGHLLTASDIKLRFTLTFCPIESKRFFRIFVNFAKKLLTFYKYSYIYLLRVACMHIQGKRQYRIRGYIAQEHISADPR